jgi:hypothetical protein
VAEWVTITRRSAPSAVARVGAGGEGGQAGEALGVDHPEAAPRHRQQVGVVGDDQAADEVQPAGLDVGLPGGRVAAGVVDQGECVGGPGQRPEASHQFVDHRRELGHVGTVALVGVGADRHPAVAGHHQPKADQAQVEPLLLGMAPPGKLVAVVGRVDERGEVGHVQHQRAQVQPELGDHARGDGPLGGAQVGLADGVHRVPEAAMVHRGGRQPDQPVADGGPPPASEAELGAGRHHPVEGGQGQVGPDRGGRVRAPGAQDLVDDLGDAESLEHRPGRGQVPERPVASAVGRTRSGRRQPRGNLLGAAQVALGHDPGVAGDPGRLHQVVVGARPPPLPDDACHDLWVIHQADKEGKHLKRKEAAQAARPAHKPTRIPPIDPLARKLGLGPMPSV